jgi:hypothetical protein
VGEILSARSSQGGRYGRGPKHAEITVGVGVILSTQRSCGGRGGWDPKPLEIIRR